MKQIQLEPYKPKDIETCLAAGVGYGDMPFHQSDNEDAVCITYWKCKSLLGRLLFLFNGKIELKQITGGIEKPKLPTALCINIKESK